MTVSQLGKRLLISAGIAITICIANYFFNCLPYPFWDNLKIICWADYATHKVLPVKDCREDVFFVNVSHDKKVIETPYIGENPSLSKKSDRRVITDRKVLYDFLCLADSLNMNEGVEYKCIFLDIMLEKGYSDSDSDSLLIQQILKMKNVYFTRRQGKELLDERLKERALYNDYYTSIIATNFTRYQYVQHGEISAPLGIFSSLTGTTINNCGPFFFSNNRLCYNSPMIYIPNDFFVDDNSDSSNLFEISFPYYDYGPFTRIFPNEIVATEIADSINGKLVIVGDFINDIHDTYKGVQPGPWIVYLAFKQLSDGKYLVNWIQFFVFFIIYVLMSLSLLYEKGVVDLVKRVHLLKNSHFLMFVSSFMSYGLLLFVFNVLMYVFFGTIYNIFIPNLIFTLLNYIISYRKS